MKNKTYVDPTIEFSFFDGLDVMETSGNGADFDVGELLGVSVGGEVL